VRPDEIALRLLRLDAERMGRPLAGVFRDSQGFARLLWYALSHWRVLRREPVWLVFLKQVYFTGIQALPAIAVMAALSGVVVTAQIVSLAGQSPGLLAKIMLWVVVRELGPLLTAIVIIARSSAATASELASMTVRGEIDALRSMGISPNDYLMVPRVAAVTVSVMVVTFYFQVIAVMAGVTFNAVAHGVPFWDTVRALLDQMSQYEILVSMIKGMVFGFMISVTSCYFGFNAQRSVTAVPRAATSAVVRNLLGVFVVDGVITYAAFV